MAKGMKPQLKGMIEIDSISLLPKAKRQWQCSRRKMQNVQQLSDPASTADEEASNLWMRRGCCGTRFDFYCPWCSVCGYDELRPMDPPVFGVPPQLRIDQQPETSHAGSSRITDHISDPAFLDDPSRPLLTHASGNPFLSRNNSVGCSETYSPEQRNSDSSGSEKLRAIARTAAEGATSMASSLREDIRAATVPRKIAGHCRGAEQVCREKARGLIQRIRQEMQ